MFYIHLHEYFLLRTYRMPGTILDAAEQYRIRYNHFFLRSEGSRVEVRTVARQLSCSDKSVLLEEYVAGLSNDESVQLHAAGE